MEATVKVAHGLWQSLVVARDRRVRPLAEARATWMVRCVLFPAASALWRRSLLCGQREYVSR